MASRNMKDYDYQLGKIAARLDTLPEMHKDIKEIRENLSKLKINTRMNTEFRVSHTKTHIEMEKQLNNLESFKTKVYAYASVIGLLMGGIGSQVMAAWQTFMK